MPKNILIIKPSSLGDIVLALPALSALRRDFPNAHISWLVRPDFAPILKDHPHLDEIILFDRKFLGQSWYNPKAMKALLTLIFRLRRGKFDAVIDLQGLFRTAVLGWLSGCKKRFGMKNAREFAVVFYNHKIEQTQNDIHLVDYYMKIIKAAGVSDTHVEFVLPRNSKDDDSVHSLLKKYDVGSDGYAVFIPASAQLDKCWSAEKFAQLADRIFDKFKIPVIAVGTNSESDIAEKINSLSSVPIINIAGQTSLGELTALLRAASLVVSNDTGPGHIAAALGVPLVLIFGWSNPARIIPYGKAHCAAAVEPESRGLKIKSYDPKHDVKMITVDQVYEKVLRQLER